MSAKGGGSNDVPKKINAELLKSAAEQKRCDKPVLKMRQRKNIQVIWHDAG